MRTPPQLMHHAYMAGLMAAYQLANFFSALRADTAQMHEGSQSSGSELLKGVDRKAARLKMTSPTPRPFPTKIRLKKMSISPLLLLNLSMTVR